MATDGSTFCFGTSQEDQMLPSEHESQVIPKPLLLKVLRFAGAQNETFTVKEVMYYLGQYIMTKQLYDEKQQHIVHCSDELLSHLFGVQSFSLKEPRILYAMLSKNLTSVNHKDSINDLSLGKEITNGNLGGEDCHVTGGHNDVNACSSCSISCSPVPGRKSNFDSDTEFSSDEQFYSGRRKRHRSDSISLHGDDLSLYLINKLRRERGNSESSDSPSHLDLNFVTEGEDSSDKFSVEFEVESIHSEDYSDLSEDSPDASDEEVYEVAIYEAADSDEDTFIEEIDPEMSVAIPTLPRDPSTLQAVSVIDFRTEAFPCTESHCGPACNRWNQFTCCMVSHHNIKLPGKMFNLVCTEKKCNLYSLFLMSQHFINKEGIY
ncbi:E3 ubiquitin-protein ligase Mdm2 isoform X5 [Narcine bancroftii]|uniref:E3 ubiquitin-protein ligase Mdm2 isoform X5 n=1 Tax=Narcine bancroftii TaxID=1343680 RepID=UPI0038310575